MIFYYLVFFTLCLFCIFSSDKKIANFLFIFSACILVTMAAFRSSNIDKDHAGYIEYYNEILSSGWSIVEPSFILITKIVDSTFGNVKWIFILYALFGVVIKYFAIDSLTEYRFLTIIVYFSGYFLLFEMTQIRAGVAAGFFLLCIKPIQQKNALLFLSMAILAILFHYSAIIILPFFFIDAEKLNQRLYAFLIPAAYILYFLHIDVFSVLDILPIPLLQAKLTSYSMYALEDNTINLFNVIQLFRCVIAFLVLWKYKLLYKNNVYSIIIIKIYFFALVAFVALASIPGISSRISELLLVVEILLIPLLLYLFKPKHFGAIMVIVISLAFLSFSLFYTHLLKPYF